MEAIRSSRQSAARSPLTGYRVSGLSVTGRSPPFSTSAWRRSRVGSSSASSGPGSCGFSGNTRAPHCRSASHASKISGWLSARSSTPSPSRTPWACSPAASTSICAHSSRQLSRRSFRRSACASPRCWRQWRQGQSLKVTAAAPVHRRSDTAARFSASCAPVGRA